MSNEHMSMDPRQNWQRSTLDANLMMSTLPEEEHSEPFPFHSAEAA